MNVHAADPPGTTVAETLAPQPMMAAGAVGVGVGEAIAGADKEYHPIMHQPNVDGTLSCSYREKGAQGRADVVGRGLGEGGEK